MIYLPSILVTDHPWTHACTCVFKNWITLRVKGWGKCLPRNPQVSRPAWCSQHTGQSCHLSNISHWIMGALPYICIICCPRFHHCLLVSALRSLAISFPQILLRNSLQIQGPTSQQQGNDYPRSMHAHCTWEIRYTETQQNTRAHSAWEETTRTLSKKNHMPYSKCLFCRIHSSQRGKQPKP